MRSTYAQWLRYAAYTLLVLAVVVGGYYFVYVQQEKKQLANDRLTLLQESSGYFTEELGRVQENIENTLQDTSKLVTAAKLDSALEQISGIPHASTSHWEDDSLCTSVAKNYSDGHNQHVELSARFERSVSHPHLSFTLADTTESDTMEGGISCELAAANPDSLLIPLLPRDESAFDKIFLARWDGRVLVSSGRGSISMVRLPLANQAPVDEEYPEDSKGPDGLHSEIFTMEAAGISHRVFLQPFTVPVNITYTKSDGTNKDISEDEETVYLAGVKQEQALQAEARRLPPTLLAILVGVVALALLAFPFLEVWLIGPTESFQPHDVFEVAVGVVIASSIVTLAVLSFFCVEQLKEKQFDQLERLSGVIRATLHTEVEAANQQLTHLTRLVRACGSSCRQQTQIWKGAVSVHDSIRVISDDSLHYPHLEMASWINQEAMQVAKWSVEDQTTPLIKLDKRGYVRAHEAALDWAWPASQHSEVWEYPKDESTEWVLESIRSKNTGEVFAQISQSLDSSIYFKRDTTVVDTVSISNEDKSFDIEDTVTLKGGRKIVGKDVERETAVVAASTLPLLSMIDPVLPPGFRFAVIDEEGNVLFHSDTRRNLRENIFDKIIDGEHLRDAVFARQADRASARYREDKYQFYSHPVSNSPWTLLVFAELQPLRAMHGHILTSGFVLYAGYLLFLLLFVLLPWMGYQALYGSAQFSLQGLFYALWPNSEEKESYQSLFWGEVVILFLGLGLFVFVLTDGSLWSLILVGVLAALALFFFLDSCGGEEPTLDDIFGLGITLDRLSQSPKWDWPNQYLASLFLLVLNVGVLPVLVSFTLVHDESAELLQKQNQLVFAQRLENRGEKWVDYYRGDDQRIALNSTARETLKVHLFPGGAWTPRKDSLRMKPWDVHTDPGLMEVRSPKVESTRCSRGDTRDAVQPVYKALSKNRFIKNTSFWERNLHPFSDSRSSDASWTWTTSEGDTLTFRMGASRRAGLPPAGEAAPASLNLRISSPVPTVAGLLQLDFLTVLLILFFIAILPVFLWWVLRKLNDQIFFMGLAPVAKTEGTQPRTSDQPERPDRILYLRGHPDGDPIDASELCDVTDPSKLRRAKTLDDHLSEFGESDGRVVIHNFHDGLRSAEVVERKHALLEGLVDLDKDVEMHSDVDPLPYLREHFDEEEATASAPIDLDAWATVLRPFRKESAAVKVAAESGEALEELRSALDLSDDQPVPDQVEVVTRECSVDPYLRHRIGQIGSAVVGDWEESSLSEEQVLEQVKYHARAHYQHLWMTCTDREKVILYRLSTDGFVSPHSRDIVEQLLRRGLLVMEPELRPMNESFRRFVAALDSPVIGRYEEQASSTAWRRVRVPLLIAFALVIGFVFYTQPGLVKEWMGVLAPALAAGLPALINVFSGLFGGQGADGSGMLVG